MNTRISFIVCIAVLTLCFIPTTATEAQLFESSVEYGAADDPRSVAIGDLGGDSNGRHLPPVDAGTNRTEVMMTKVNDVYYVPVEINSVLKISFIFDSGAGDVMITPDVFRTLFRTGTVTEDDYLPGQNYRIADGSVVENARFILRSVKIGDRTVNNVTCSISNSLEASMLLGQSVLEKLGKYTFDYDAMKLIIE